MQFTKKVLPNGLRIITVPMQENKTVTAMVLVEAGSRYESKENNGISHFLEHMCFKGTKKRSNALAISTEFERMGGHYNAFTAGSYTGYFAKAAAAHSDRIIEMVSDLYLNAALPQEEIEKEKGVVIEEMNMNKDRPQRIVWDVLDELVYDGNPLGQTVIGTKETVKSITHDGLLAYRKTHYVPAKTVVVISGGFNETAVVASLESLFGHIESGEAIPFEKVVENQQAPQVKLFNKSTDQSHFVLAFRSFSRFDERMQAASILKTILGSGMSSRLFQRLREELGLCYYVGAGQKLEQDCGLFTIGAGVAHDKALPALSEIMKLISKFLAEGPTEEELQKAKDFKIGSLYLGLETSDQLGDWYGFQEIEHEDIITPEEHEKQIIAVTKEEVWNVAKDIFKIDHANFAMVGPHEGKDAQFIRAIKL
jgi:predicted Zn-dependent peptidase